MRCWLKSRLCSQSEYLTPVAAPVNILPMDPEFTSDALDLADDTEQQAVIPQYTAEQERAILANFRAKFGDAALLAMIRAFHPGYQTTPAQAREIRRTLHADGVKPPRLDA